MLVIIECDSDLDDGVAFSRSLRKPSDVDMVSTSYDITLNLAWSVFSSLVEFSFQEGRVDRSFEVTETDRLPGLQDEYEAIEFDIDTRFGAEYSADILVWDYRKCSPSIPRSSCLGEVNLMILAVLMRVTI